MRTRKLSPAGTAEKQQEAIVLGNFQPELSKLAVGRLCCVDFIGQAGVASRDCENRLVSRSVGCTAPLPQRRKGPVRRARLQPCRTKPEPARALAPEVRVSMHRHEQNLPVTTVPQRLKPSMHKGFMARLKPCPSYRFSLPENLIWTSLTLSRPFGTESKNLRVLTHILRPNSLSILYSPTKSRALIQSRLPPMLTANASMNRESEVRCIGIPHLAKNERDVGHPALAGNAVTSAVK